MKKILIADDDDDVRELLVIFIATLNPKYCISEADNGLTALDLARREQPDLILLDGVMPQMHGFDVCQHLKSDRLTQDAHIIMITSLSTNDDIERGLLAGADEYLVKPVEMKMLAAKIDEIFSL